MQRSAPRTHVGNSNPLSGTGTDLFYLPVQAGQTVGDLQLQTHSSMFGGCTVGSPALAGATTWQGQPAQLVRVSWRCATAASRVSYYLTWRRYDSLGQCLDPEPVVSKPPPKKHVSTGPADPGHGDIVLVQNRRVSPLQLPRR
jgi:hypothetical protein